MEANGLSDRFVVLNRAMGTPVRSAGLPVELPLDALGVMNGHHMQEPAVAHLIHGVFGDLEGASGGLHADELP